MHPCSGKSRADAWLNAAKILCKHRDRAYNVIVEVEDPALVTPRSRAIEARVDAFLAAHDCQPIHTVAETIFPSAEYVTGGLKKVLEYPQSIYPEIRSISANSQGTYALRLTQRKCSDGTTMQPLDVLIEKLRRQLKGNGPQRAVYELDMCLEPMELKFYDPEIDHGNVRGGQCLSHISLKLGHNRELYLTALYRYQYFIQKALGNLKGLARLQGCIAREVGISVGPLVCHATLAVLETKGKPLPWNWADVVRLLGDCESVTAHSDATETV